MHKQCNTALAFLSAVVMPLYLAAAPPEATSNQLLSAKEVRKAEVDAKTAADHLQRAAFHLSKAERTRTKLANAEGLVNYWTKQPGMAGRSKVPNPYVSATPLAQLYRAELQKELNLAAIHQMMAQSIEATQSKRTP